MCKGPVVVRIKAGARVKEGWCDWGHERDGHNEREKDGARDIMVTEICQRKTDTI